MGESNRWEIQPSSLLTKWSKSVDPSMPWPSYPRPQFKRQDWLNLNGLWEYSISNFNTETMPTSEGYILVPYPVESALSGVKRKLEPKNLLWYRRKFTLPSKWHDKRIILHFEAVDWETTVYINDHLVGVHRGGYTPFSFDITLYLSKNMESENTIIIKVFDPTEKGHQPSGKQWLKPAIVFYTSISGIWQTVWLEPVPYYAIEKIEITPDIDTDQLLLLFTASFHPKDPGDEYISNDKLKSSFELEITVFDKEKSILSIRQPFQKAIILKLPPLKRWTPENPILYGLKIKLLQQNTVFDCIESYFAMRSFSLESDSQGRMRFHLNHKPYFMMGVLDQGYWPDGLYTAPTEDALRYDLEIIKKCGYNMVRKHIKIEPSLWYYYCDQMGLIVWQDMPNGGGKGVITRQFLLHILHLNPKDDRNYWFSGYGKPEHRKNFRQELHEMIDHLYNVPSIAVWVLFNEAWGQFDTVSLTEWLKKRDPSRLIDAASGWFDKKVGHFVSVHNYNDKFQMPSTFNYRGVVLSEIGGYTLPIINHEWNPKKKFGYKRIKSRNELEQAYFNLINNILLPAVKQGLSGVVYTQITDVEIEYNGLMTYDRSVLKIVPEKFKKWHEFLLNLE
ncbi:MAG: beta-galactosidase [Candidatus Lokiarchaeota archaeon]|nr:beta-galactosidase [Candidatus Harpocratesius repetitus]